MNANEIRSIIESTLSRVKETWPEGSDALDSWEYAIRQASIAEPTLFSTESAIERFLFNAFRAHMLEKRSRLAKGSEQPAVLKTRSSSELSDIRREFLAHLANSTYADRQFESANRPSYITTFVPGETVVRISRSYDKAIARVIDFEVFVARHYLLFEYHDIIARYSEIIELLTKVYMVSPPPVLTKYKARVSQQMLIRRLNRIRWCLESTDEGKRLISKITRTL